MNRAQAKLLAPIICAYAAGSKIEWQNSSGKWLPCMIEDDLYVCIQNNIKLRIAPKPPKQKFARIALCNLANLTLDNCVDFPCHQIQSRTPSDGMTWSPVEVIIRKGHCKDFEQHPVFVKWLSNEFQLTTQPRA